MYRRLVIHPGHHFREAFDAPSSEKLGMCPHKVLLDIIPLQHRTAHFAPPHVARGPPHHFKWMEVSSALLFS